MTPLGFDYPLVIGDPVEKVFRLRQSAANNGSLWIGGGIAALIFAVFGFLIAVFARTDAISLQLMTTLPVLIGISTIGMGKTLSRAPWEIGVGPRGVRLLTRNGSQV